MKVNQGFHLALLCLVFNGNAIAQNKDTLAAIGPKVNLKEVEIKANRLRFMERKVPKNIEVISQQQIKAMPAQSFAELLSYQAAIDIRQRGPMGVQADLGINGGNFSQSQLLVNGMKMSDPQTGHHLMNLAIPMQFVEQIELIKGGATKRYGQNAFGGAVNIQTKIPEENNLYVNLLGGDYNLVGGNVAASFGGKKYRQILSVDHKQSNGYRHNTDFLISNAFYQGAYTINEHERLNLLLAYSDRSFGANGFYASPEATEQYEEVQTAVGSASYVKTFEKWELKPRISWRQNTDQYDFIRAMPESYRNLHQTNTYSAELNVMNQNSWGESAFGFEYRRENISGDETRASILNKSRLNGKFRDNVGFYGEHKFSLFNDRLILNPGFYAAWYSDFGQYFFPAIDAAVFINEALNFFSSIGKSFRLPAFYDQYYDSPLEKGNPNLKPEHAISSELGLRFVKKAWTAKAVYLHRNNKQLIDWVMQENTTYWSTTNHSKLQSNAFDLSLSYQLANTNQKKFSLDGFSLAYYYSDQLIGAESELPSLYVLDYMKSQFISKLHFRLFDKAKVSVVYRNLKRVAEEGYQLLDLKLSYQLPKLLLFVDFNNLMDTEYVEVMTQMPGRWVKFGANFKINL